MGFGVLVVLVVVTGSIGLYGLRQGSTHLESMGNQSFPGLNAIGKVQSRALEIRGSTYLMALPGLPEYKAKQLARMATLEQELPKILAEYGSGVSEEEQPLYEKTKAASVSFLETCKEYRKFALAGKLQQGTEFWQAKGTTEWPKLRDALQTEINFHIAEVERHLKAGRSSAHSVTQLTWLLLVVAVGCGIGLSYLVVKSINDGLRQASFNIRASTEQVASASGQMSSASEKLSQDASRQAASLQETSASGHEISAMTQRNAENSLKASALMKDVDQRVLEANQKLELMETSMSAISTSSDRIAKIIKVIDEIAFQTNILALNAAVEAARAGESGMGFAVVADEVRSLAQRCAQAANDTTSLIEESVTNAKNGGTRLGEVSEVIGAITKSSATVKALVDEVSAGRLSNLMA